MMTDSEDLFIDGPEGRLSVRAKGLSSRPSSVAVLVQGANLSGQTGYDFQYPADPSYSLMDALVEQGIGAVTFALRGYGRSDAPADPLAVMTPEAIEDLDAVVQWLGTKGVDRVDLLGWSWGGRIIGHYACQQPERVRRLVLIGPALGGGALVTPGPQDAWWRPTRDDYEARLESHLMDAGARNAFIDHLLAYDTRSPNGIRMENALGSTRVDPTAISCPVLMLYGSEGGKQTYMRGNLPRSEFFEALPTTRKTLMVVPGGGDYGHLQSSRRTYHRAIGDFLTTD
jgi:pimeloyl-ACP methyl ester carboxylesterase